MVRAGGPPTTSLFIAQTLQSHGWSAFADHDNDKLVFQNISEPDSNSAGEP